MLDEILLQLCVSWGRQLGELGWPWRWGARSPCVKVAEGAGRNQSSLEQEPG